MYKGYLQKFPLYNSFEIQLGTFRLLFTYNEKQHNTGEVVKALQNEY